MLGPGSLWVDDLKLTGEAAPRAVRLNAQRTLLAAIQAYRNGQYAEFARLSGSHWARHPSVLASIRSGTPDAMTGHSRPRSDGSKEASALSPNSRLR
jgi:hypothetical protein